MGGLAPTILDRDVARVQIQPIRRLGEPLLRAVVDEGVSVFERCSKTAPDGDQNLGILFPFHHLLEMGDGVEVLLAESGVVASQPLLRSMFEALIGLKYVLQEDTEERALCYVVADIKNRIRWYDAMDPTTDRGRAYRKDMGMDQKPGFPIPPIEDVQRSRARLQRMLEKPLYSEHAAEYESVRKRRKRVPPWFSLDGGPGNLRELAQRTGDLDDYLILYDQWSKTTHAVDLARQLGREGDKPTITTIRSPRGIEKRYLFAIYFVVDATRRILEYYRPGELPRFGKWYQQHVSTPLAKLEQVDSD